MQHVTQSLHNRSCQCVKNLLHFCLQIFFFITCCSDFTYQNFCRHMHSIKTRVCVCTRQNVGWVLKGHSPLCSLIWCGAESAPSPPPHLHLSFPRPPVCSSSLTPTLSPSTTSSILHKLVSAYISHLSSRILLPSLPSPCCSVLDWLGPRQPQQETGSP